MGTGPDDRHRPAHTVVRRADLTAKTVMVLMLALTLIDPSWGNLEGKAAGARALAYPLLAFTIPLIWFRWWRERADFPWLADLFVTVTCFSDVLGNRLDLYDRIWWFDDWMHFMNTGLLVAAVLMLTLHRAAGLGAVLERSLAFGVTAALAWEIAEYFAFISRSSELQMAYTDTLADLVLGTIGSITAGLLVHGAWRRGMLRDSAPHLTSSIV